MTSSGIDTFEKPTRLVTLSSIILKMQLCNLIENNKVQAEVQV